MGGGGTPTLNQERFQGFEDDAAYGSATTIAALNTNFSYDVDTQFLIAFSISNSGTKDESNLGCQLQYNLGGAGWNDVNASSSVVQMAASANLTEGNDTSDVLGGTQTFDTTNAGQEDGDGVTANNTLAQGERIDVVYCVQIIGSDVNNSDTIQLRIIAAPSTALDNYNNTPTITANKVASTYTQSHFQFNENDGALEAATGIAAEDTDISRATDTDTRYRAQVYKTSGDANANEAFQLQRNLNSGGWVNVTGATSVVIIVGTGGNYFDEEATAQDLTSPGGSFIAGRADQNNGRAGTGGAIDFSTAEEFTEVEYNFQIVDADVSDSDVIDFRVVAETYGTLDTYTNLGRITVGSGVTGTAAITLGALTLSSTGTADVDGSANITLGALTSSAAGEVDIDGSANITLGALTSSAAGEVDVDGTADNTLGGLTLSSTGTVTDPQITGTANITLGALTLSSAGEVDIDGSANITLGALTSSAAGEVDVDGTADNTLGGLTLSSTGTVEDTTITGNANITLGALTLSSAGQVDIDGTANNTLGALTLSSTGTADVDGSANITLGALTSAAAGEVDIDGTADNTLGVLTLDSSGVVGDQITGSANITLGALTLSSAGEVDIDGSANITLGALTSSAAGEVDIDGTADNTLGGLTLSSTGTVEDTTITGSANITLGALTLSSAGEVDVDGSANITLGALTSAAAGEVDVDGSGTITLGVLTLSSAGIVGLIILPTGSATYHTVENESRSHTVENESRSHTVENVSRTHEVDA